MMNRWKTNAFFLILEGARASTGLCVEVKAVE